MKEQSNRRLITVLLILVLVLSGTLGAMLWFLNSHFFVGGKAYSNQAQALDLRDRELSWEEYETIQAELPDCEIRWNVPFQGKAYPNDITDIRIERLAGQDIKALSYFESLTAVDASGCRDYEALQELQKQYPQIRLTYTVPIGGRDYPQDAEQVVCRDLTDEDISMMAWLPDLKTVDASDCRNYEQIGKLTQTYPEMNVSYRVELLGDVFTEADEQATFERPDVSELMEKLSWLPHLEQIHLVEPQASAAALRSLTERYPDVTFTWDKTVLGRTLSSTQTEIDLSGQKFDSTDAVEEAMAYFPHAEKVIMSNCGIDNETMAAFREKMRPEYKVVWTVYVTKKPVRTDQEVIHSSAMKVSLIDEQSFDLKYCEDAIVVDVGHSYIKDTSWVEGMPNLKYLILGDNWLRDLTPLSSCKNLIYLELFDNKYIKDYSPLLGCTSLLDLNISGTYADLDVLEEMTWLENLWINRRDVPQREARALQEALPNTRVQCNGGSHTGNGWRDLQAYFDMRDIMGLPYNKW